MNRKLASIQVIKDIQPIPNADKIEVVSFNELSWKCVCRKGEFSIGDKCLYLEIDSILKRNLWSEFLFKKPEDTTFRLRTIRLKGQISQGLALPLKLIPELTYNFEKDTIAYYDGNEFSLVVKTAVEGLDVTDILKIEKYEVPIPAQLVGIVKRPFPTNLCDKTDEHRIQSYPGVLDEFKGREVYISTKVDGTSLTVIYFNGEIDVCSRNMSLKESEGNTYWEVVKKHNIIEKLSKSGKNIAIQGECYGESIQKNRLNIKGHDLAIFNVFDIDEHRYLDYAEFIEFCKVNELPTVPIDYVGEFKWNSIEELLELAKGKYIGTVNDREGIVIRPVKGFRSEVLDGRGSFKVINDEYLLKGGE
jgi:RNA ligase (TIGR02306 family)